MAAMGKKGARGVACEVETELGEEWQLEVEWHLRQSHESISFTRPSTHDKKGG